MSDINKILSDKVTSVISSSAEHLSKKLRVFSDGKLDLGPMLREAVEDAIRHDHKTNSDS